MNIDLINKNLTDLRNDIIELCKEYEDDLGAEKIMYVIIRIGCVLAREIIKEHPEEKTYILEILHTAIKQGLSYDE